MCSNTVKIGGQTIACRKCNQCINARKNGWVARCMAEKATSKHTFMISLTYDESTQENRDAAKVFSYKDIRDFMSRVRRAVQYKCYTDTKNSHPELSNMTEKEYAKSYGRETIRFVVAGENGSKKGRCHWHIILFTNVDLLEVGTWTNFWTGKEIDRQTVIGRKNVGWTLWKSGHLNVIEPDEGGMEYVLKYALKDQHNVQSAKGTMRESKSENYSSGYFRMSKKPPIGEEYLKEWLNRHEAKNAIPIALKVNVPEYRGYWYPLRTLREKMLKAIYEINERIRVKTGKDAPQRTVLLSTVIEQQKEWEIIKNGTETQEDEADYERNAEHNKREFESRGENLRIRRKCGRYLPCQDCANGYSDREIEEITREAQKGDNKGKSLGEIEAEYKQARKPSPFCLLRETDRVQNAFKNFA